MDYRILIDFSLTVKAAPLIFISERGKVTSSAKEGKSGFIYNFVNSKLAFWAPQMHASPNRLSLTSHVLTHHNSRMFLLSTETF